MLITLMSYDEMLMLFSLVCVQPLNSTSACDVQTFQFTCRYGKIQECSKEFLAFKEQFGQSTWGRSVLMWCIELICLC